MERIWCMAVGYLFGCFLTAVVYVRLKSGMNIFEMGSGNPGMTNVGRFYGFKGSAVVLLGDILKTVLAMWICHMLFSPAIGKLAMVYAGFGTVLGHDFPFWHHFQGGEGVTATATWVILMIPLWAVILGILAIGLTYLIGHLKIGALIHPFICIPVVFYYCGWEAGILLTIAALLMVWHQKEVVIGVIKGTAKKSKFSFKWKKKEKK